MTPKGRQLDGFRRLERFARAVETKLQPEANFDAVIAHEKAISRSLNGRSVFDDTPGRHFKNNTRGRFDDNGRQRSLF